VAGAEKSYSADFQHINMHAISSDQSAFQRPCIYMQLEPSTPQPDDETDTDGLDDDEMPEVRLVPTDASACASKTPSVGYIRHSIMHL